MFDNLKPGDIIEQRDFDVETPDGAIHRYTLTLEKSCMFEYGNGTCVALKVDGKFYTMFDTRYAVGIVGNFRDWAWERVNAVLRDICIVYPIDPATGKRGKPGR